MRKSLLDLARSHTVLIITHSPALVQSCHNVVIMERGRIRAAGPTQKVIASLNAPRPDNEPVVRVVASEGKPS